MRRFFLYRAARCSRLRRRKKSRAEKISIAPLHFLKRRLYCAALAQTALSGQDEAGEQPNLK